MARRSLSSSATLAHLKIFSSILVWLNTVSTLPSTTLSTSFAASRGATHEQQRRPRATEAPRARALPALLPVPVPVPMTEAFPPGREGWVPGPGDSHGTNRYPHVLSPAGALLRDTEMKELQASARNLGTACSAVGAAASSSSSSSP